MEQEQKEKTKGNYYVLVKTKTEAGRWLYFRHNESGPTIFDTDEAALEWRANCSRAGRMEYSLYKLKRIDHEQD